MKRSGTAIGHVDAFHDGPSGAMEHREEVDLLAKVDPDGFDDFLVKIFGQGGGVEVTVERPGLVLDHHMAVAQGVWHSTVRRRSQLSST